MTHMVMYDNTGVTVELRKLVEAGVKIWDFDYPTYYPKGSEEKAAFEQKVLDHFWFRQIGQETTGRFLHAFRTKVREIMPYYIQRYESAALLAAQEDPLESYRLTEELEQTNTGTSSGTNLSERRFSDTPQGRISNLDDYMTQAEVVDGGSNGHTSGTTKSKLTRYGNIGVQPLGQELNTLRSAFIDVDLEIIGELNSLFLGVY